MTGHREVEGYVSKEELQRQQYEDSMDAAGHIQVVLDRVVTGEGGDWVVYTSYSAVLNKLGKIISKDMLTYSETIEFMGAREKLNELDNIGRYGSETTPKDEASYGFLLGVKLLVEKVVEIKAEG